MIPRRAVAAEAGIGPAARAGAWLAAAVLGLSLVPPAAGAGFPTSCIDGACHVAVQKRLKKGRHVHEAARDASCDTCHEPHANGRPGKIRNPLTPICAECHDNLTGDSGGGGRLHRPVAQGKCPACHDPHASDLPRLLVAPFPEGGPGGLDAAAYGLCWKCHDRAIVTAPRTSTGTSFRDGARNLHAIHLERTRGATCLTCHELHRRAAAKLIAGGKGRTAFSPTSVGGSCVPPCHAERRYDRVKPSRP